MGAPGRLQALIAAVATRSETWVVEEPMRLLEAGEWGVAFETLADNVYEVELPLYDGEVLEFELIGRHLAEVSPFPTRRASQLVRELLVDDGVNRR